MLNEYHYVDAIDASQINECTLINTLPSIVIHYSSYNQILYSTSIDLSISRWFELKVFSLFTN